MIDVVKTMGDVNVNAVIWPEAITVAVHPATDLHQINVIA